MLEGNYYRSVGTMFPLVAAFVGACTGYGEASYVTDMETRYSVRLIGRSDNGGPTEWTEKDINFLENDLYCLKTLFFEVSGPHFPNGLHTFTFYLLDHLSSDLRKVCSMALKNASAFKHLNMLVKKLYRSTSIISTMVMEEIVRGIEPFHK